MIMQLLGIHHNHNEISLLCFILTTLELSTYTSLRSTVCYTDILCGVSKPKTSEDIGQSEVNCVVSLLQEEERRCGNVCVDWKFVPVTDVLPVKSWQSVRTILRVFRKSENDIPFLRGLVVFSVYIKQSQLFWSCITLTIHNVFGQNHR